ncbi:4790_t:CDS:2 [Entrophospora sp. SA101]|nr:4790_t:CDS:2 [Entrophospora sp. SA101]CAJ0824928.1 12888_t:CDS:2 [Entrophospora sp. SA101]CAJ0844560.1 4156_t:CDS:2 [Entrophospora sp. SA101]
MFIKVFKFFQVNKFTYENTFWPQLSNFIQNTLQVESQIKRPLHTYSHEELYRSIYWICLQGFQKRLYQDLKLIIEETLEFINNRLGNYKQLDEWFQKFAEISINHARAIEILSSDKTFVKHTLNENLKDVLVDRFQCIIIQRSEMHIIQVFSMIVDDPKLFDSNIVKEVLNNIYLNPALFQNLIEHMIIPNDFEAIDFRHKALEAKYQLEKLKNGGLESRFPQLKRSSSAMIDGMIQEKIPCKRQQI